jgi:hypothetical protein
MTNSSRLAHYLSPVHHLFLWQSTATYGRYVPVPGLAIALVDAASLAHPVLPTRCLPPGAGGSDDISPCCIVHPFGSCQKPLNDACNTSCHCIVPPFGGQLQPPAGLRATSCWCIITSFNGGRQPLDSTSPCPTLLSHWSTQHPLQARFFCQDASHPL